jgi:hypothetical protein
MNQQASEVCEILESVQPDIRSIMKTAWHQNEREDNPNVRNLRYLVPTWSLC